MGIKSYDTKLWLFLNLPFTSVKIETLHKWESFPSLLYVYYIFKFSAILRPELSTKRNRKISIEREVPGLKITDELLGISSLAIKIK